MTILTTFLGVAFVSTFISLCWLTDKYSDTLDELETYKRQNKFLQSQIEENRRIYKNALQSYKSANKRSTTHN